MVPGVRSEAPPATPDGCTAADAEVVEVGLLLTAGEAKALEAEAHRRGLAVGPMVRLLLRDFLRWASAPSSQLVPRSGGDPARGFGGSACLPGYGTMRHAGAAKGCC